MAYIFRLNSEPEGTAVNLVVEDSWSPTVSYDGGDVVETIPVSVEGLTDDEQAANMQALHRIQENVRFYVNEPSSQYTQETWLEWQMLDESSTSYRRRLVKALDIAFDAGMWFTCGDGNIAQKIRATLTMRVAGWWESSSTQSPFDTLLSTTLMEPIAYPVLLGDAPGRLDLMRLTDHAGAGVDDIWGAYVGFRSEKRHGTLANFEPLWECELGAVSTDTAVDLQGGASPSDAVNNCMTTTFATDATLTDRVILEFDDITANFSDNYGRFIVLYRAKVDAATTSCTVRVDARAVTSGAVSAPPDITGTAFTVTNDTTWRCFETGLIVQLPPSGTHTTIPIPEQYGFTIYASRSSVAGSLYSDCLILVPIDEYMVYCFTDMTGKLVSIPGGDYMGTYFYSAPDETKSMMLVSSPSDYVFSVDIPYTEGDGVPPGTTWAYFLIYNSPTRDNTRTSDADVTMRVYPRYHSLQGAG